MKQRIRTIFLILLLLSGISDVYAQSCLPEGIVFSLQAQIDSFPVNYPGCTEIEGSVEISGADITNLSGLASINTIGGNLIFIFCQSLTSLDGLQSLNRIDSTLVFQQNYLLSSLNGLENLSSIGMSLTILGNSSLTNLAGLEQLSSVGRSIWIEENYALSSLTGLENLTIVGGDLFVLISYALKDLQGLDNLTNIGGELYISFNNDMSSLTGLEKLVSIGNGIRCSYNMALTELTALYSLREVGGQLSIRSNDALSSLAGLDNINPSSISDLDISFNNLLSTCHVQSICDYLTAPNGEVFIASNAPGCNSKNAVEDSCATLDIGEQVLGIEIQLYPNPAINTLNIRYPISDPSTTLRKGVRHLLFIYDLYGRQMDEVRIPAKNQDIRVDVSSYPAGLYFVVLKDENGIDARKKFIVK